MAAEFVTYLAYWFYNNIVWSEQESKKPDLITILLWLFLSVGVFALGFGVWQGRSIPSEGLVVEEKKDLGSRTIWVDISGAVVRPGVYEVDRGMRLAELIILAGGFDESVDMEMVTRSINQASLVGDGQKIYIPKISVSGQVSGASANSDLVSLNSSGRSDLEKLVGVGEVRSQRIIDGRPYMSIEEAIEKGAITESIRVKNADILTL
jgi:DNA uptake protein ComE-like DNA-binding protein